MAQVVGSDRLEITPIQLTMAISFGQVFGITLDYSTAQAACASGAAMTIGRTLHRCCADGFQESETLSTLVLHLRSRRQSAGF